MKSSLSNLAYEWKLENGKDATLAELLYEMGIPNYESIPYEGFIHSLARGIMKANQEKGWKGGYSYKK